MNYAIFCYKDNAVDTCRGQVMNQFDADFQYLLTENLNEMAEFFADMQWRAAKRDTYDSDYEYHILINGRDPQMSDNEADNLEYEKIQTLAAAILAERKEKEQRTAEAKIEEKRQADLLQEKIRIEQKEQAERSEFIRLSEKFGRG